jgi:formylglycine-generating enzyme required for sulfatase activity
VTFEEYAKGTYGHRVVRGGSFDAAEPKALKNGAHYSDPESRISFHLGFRCARDIKK